MKQIKVCSVAFFLSLALSACSQNPTMGEKMIHQGDDIKKIGDRWYEGYSLVKKGDKDITEGKSMIKQGSKAASKGKAKVKHGNSLIAKGKKMMHKSENDFQRKINEDGNADIASASSIDLM